MAEPLRKRVVSRIYSFAAKSLYDPLVAKGTFRLVGIEPFVFEHGRKAVAVAAGAPILDMPVGTAYFTIEMARIHPGIVVGVDIAEGMVVKAKQVAHENGIANLVPLQADAHHLPFADGAFPAIGCWNGLPVMPGLRASIRELARVLAPGGTLFISALSIPLSSLVGPRRGQRLPTMLRSHKDIEAEIHSAGLTVTSSVRIKFARLIEAKKLSN